MPTLFIILNYAEKSLMTDLTSDEVCTMLRYFMTRPNPSFEVINASSRKFCTGDFVEMEGDNWKYEPEPQVAVTL